MYIVSLKPVKTVYYLNKLFDTVVAQWRKRVAVNATVVDSIATGRNEIFQLHAVSRTKQGIQRKPSVKTLLSPLSAEFWRHCV